MDRDLNFLDASEIRSTNSAEDFDKRGNWAELPSAIVERVYSFLCHEDQINMSQVCQKWSEGFNSPTVWKKFRFSLTESQLLMDPCPMIKCAKKYSRMFQHVEIDVIRNVSGVLIEAWCNRLKTFMDILAKNSFVVSSIKYRWPENFFLWPTLTSAEHWIELMKGFLGRIQTSHTTVEVRFLSCLFFSTIIEALAKVKDQKMFPMHIKFRRFIDPIETMDQESLDAALRLSSFSSQMNQVIPVLQTDHSFIFDIMPSPEVTPEFHLTKIILSSYGSIQQHHNPLKEHIWRLLKQLYPGFQVELYFETDSQSRHEVEFFIVPEIPLTQIDYSFNFCKSDHSSIMEIDAFLSHLLTCKINEHLISLSLAWILPVPDLASSFSPFLQACKKLKYLQIFITYPANGINSLASSWLENRPESLEKVLIDISEVGNKDNYETLIYLATEYASLLEMAGLNLEVKLNIGKTIFGESS